MRPGGERGAEVARGGCRSTVAVLCSLVCPQWLGLTLDDGGACDGSGALGGEHAEASARARDGGSWTGLERHVRPQEQLDLPGFNFSFSSPVPSIVQH